VLELIINLNICRHWRRLGPRFGGKKSAR